MQEEPCIIEIGFLDKGTGKHQGNIIFGILGIAPVIPACIYKTPYYILIEEKQSEK